MITTVFGRSIAKAPKTTVQIKIKKIVTINDVIFKMNVATDVPIVHIISSVDSIIEQEEMIFFQTFSVSSLLKIKKDNNCSH